MSDQQAPFNNPDPEQQPQEPLQEPPPLDERDVNYDPRERRAYNPQTPQPRDAEWREQPGWQAAPPPQPGAYPGPGPYPYPSPGPQQMAPGQFGQQMPRRRRRGLLACLITLIVILVIIIALLAALAGLAFSGLGGSRVTETRTFSVSGRPVLVIHDDVGAIHIHGSNTGSVVVQATKHKGLLGNQNDLQVTYKAIPDTNLITVNASVKSGAGFLSLESIDLDVTTPNGSDLQLKTDTGAIDVTNVNGQMSLTTDTGAINASQDMLTGTSNLQASTGAINFNGSIDTTGTYQFQANTGAVNVTLPADASFRLTASTDTGSFNSDFPVNVQHSGAGSSASGDIGSSPQATVILKTDTGAINLHKG